MKNTQTDAARRLKAEESRAALEPWSVPALARALGHPHDTVVEAMRKFLVQWTRVDRGLSARTLQHVVEAVERNAPQAAAILRETQGARMTLVGELGWKSTGANAWLIDWLCKGTPDAQSNAEQLWTEQLRRALDANDTGGAYDLLTSWAPTMRRADQTRRSAIGKLWAIHPQAMMKLARSTKTMEKLCDSRHPDITSDLSTLKTAKSMLEIAISRLQEPHDDEELDMDLDTWWSEVADAMETLQTLERWPFTITSIAHAWLEKGRIREMWRFCAQAPEVIHSPLVALRVAEKDPAQGAEWVRHAAESMTAKERTEWVRKLNQEGEDNGRGLYRYAIEAGCTSLADAAYEAGIEPQAAELRQAAVSITFWWGGAVTHNEFAVFYRTLERWPRLAHAQTMISLSTRETLEVLSREAHQDKAGIALARALAGTGKTTALRLLVKRWGTAPEALIDALVQETDSRPGRLRQSDGTTIPTASSLHEETVTIRFDTTHDETDKTTVNPWRWHTGGKTLEEAMRDARESAGIALSAWMAQGPPAVDPEDWKQLRETPVWTVEPGTNPAMLDAMAAGMKRWESANG